MPYNYAWAVADPEAGLDFGQVYFPNILVCSNWINFFFIG